LVEDEIEDVYNNWNDSAFVAEINKREQAYLSGTAKTFTVEQSSARARKAINKDVNFKNILS
jgi:hypothetical protein